MKHNRIGLDVGSTTLKVVVLDDHDNICFSTYVRHNARIRETLSVVFSELGERFGDELFSLTITGSVGLGIAERTQIPFVQEVVASTAYVRRYHPQATTLIDIGGEDAKVVFLKGETPDMRMNSNCAGGTGAFIDQMALLLDTTPAGLDRLAQRAVRIHPIASRCGVFAKTDIQNLLAKNVSREEIAASIFHAVAVQTVVTLSHGCDIEAPVLFCGGPLAFLPSLRKAFAEYLHLDGTQTICPADAQLLPAWGTALSGTDASLRAADEWLAKLAHELDGRSPDYLVISHMEPDHSGSILRLAEKYQEMKLVGNTKTFTMLRQFFGAKAPTDDRLLEVGEGETLPLGAHTLHFMLAPMVHWPEVMVAYEETEKLLFSADAFGRFGSLGRTANAPWAPQARRYYYNIVGKYGAQVQALLKKASALEIKTVCPLHGPVLTGEALGEALRLYDLWSRWQSESPDDILLAHASIHGNTARAAELLKQKLEAKGAQVTLCDLTTTEVSYAVANAFYCGRLVLACSTYDGGLFPPMEEFLSHLQAKGFRSRTVGLMENGSWAPAAARLMRARLEEMKDLRVCGTVVSLRSALGPANEAQMEALSAELCAE